jgi:hypothetical protein
MGLSVEMANDAMAKFNRSLDGFWRKITPGVAGAITVISNKLSGLTESFHDVFIGAEAISNVFLTAAETVAGFFARALDSGSIALNILRMAALVIEREFSRVTATMMDAVSALSSLMPSSSVPGIGILSDILPDSESLAESANQWWLNLRKADKAADDLATSIARAAQSGEGSFTFATRNALLEFRGQVEGTFREARDVIAKRGVETVAAGLKNNSKDIISLFIDGMTKNGGLPNLFDKLTKSKQIKSVGETMAKHTQSAMFKVWGAIGDQARRRFKQLSAEVSSSVKMEFTGSTGSFRSAGVGRNDEIRRTEERQISVQEDQLEVLRRILTQFLGGVPAG